MIKNRHKALILFAKARDHETTKKLAGKKANNLVYDYDYTLTLSKGSSAKQTIRRGGSVCWK